MFIRTGSTKAYSGSVEYTSTNFTRHPHYNERHVDYDVGLIRPSTPIKLDNRTKVVSLAKKKSEVNVGTPILVTGWGYISVNMIIISY